MLLFMAKVRIGFVVSSVSVKKKSCGFSITHNFVPLVAQFFFINMSVAIIIGSACDPLGSRAPLPARVKHKTLRL